MHPLSLRYIVTCAVLTYARNFYIGTSQYEETHKRCSLLLLKNMLSRAKFVSEYPVVRIGALTTAHYDFFYRF